ncbi:hypothetical protein CC2G_000089 [Coprinopsis cinerea AmutBmut pab1-1]|nr:hypothetical protein CC2G_000089 [Coprinopsis cinerea AmutBmut pab1-1]
MNSPASLEMEHFDGSNSHLERVKREHPTKDGTILNMSQATYSKDVLASVPPKALDEILGCHWTKRDHIRLEMIRSHVVLKDCTRMIVSMIFLCLAEFFTALDLVLVILPKIARARSNAVDDSQYPVEVVWGETVTNWKPTTVPANLTLFRGLQVGLLCVFEIKGSDDPEKPNFERQVPQAVAETIACMEKADVSTGKWILADGVRWVFATVHKEPEKKPTYQYLCRSYRPWDTTGKDTTALFEFMAYWLLWKSE